MSCCPSIWWCTPSGPVEVAPDGSGLYARPEGATGHPFKSESDASEGCPLPPQLLNMCCGTEYPGGMPFRTGAVISLVNRTGVYAGYPNSVFVTLNGASCSSSSCYWAAADGGIVFIVQLFCTASNKFVAVQVSSCANTATASAAGWTATALGSGTGQQFQYAYECGDNLFAELSGTQFLGTYTAAATGPANCGGSGTMDVYVTWL